MHLTCKDLNFVYPDSDVVVLENLNFNMPEPGFNAIFGPSGVGKTSFAKLLVNHRVNNISQIATRDIQTMLYSYNLERLPGWSSTGNHLEKICPPDKLDLKAGLIDIFRLEPILRARFSQLSMGQQNRMNLIRYLLQDFDLLIMDESLANVDEKLRETIILAIKELFPDKMFLYISHNLMEVARFCKDILVLGEAMGEKQSFMVKGRDYRQDYTLDKSELDRVMLEIMNAF